MSLAALLDQGQWTHEPAAATLDGDALRVTAVEGAELRVREVV